MLFKHKLIEHLDKKGIDNQCNGLLVNSENFQGLRLISSKYDKSIDGIYIDPPYNTGSDDFLYKDNYMHSSWLSMMENRLGKGLSLLKDDTAIAVSINENELYNLKELMDSIFDKYMTSLTVKVRHEDRILKGDKDFHEVYENALIFSKGTGFKPQKRLKDNTSIEDYVWDVKITSEPTSVMNLGGKDVEVYAPGTYLMQKETPSDKLTKRISVRGSIREGNSSGRFYVAYLEPIAKEYPGYLFKVPNMGDDGMGYRCFWTPSQESNRKNGDYFQGKPVNSKEVREIPYPNYVDFEREFNNCGDEGGIEYRNGKKPVKFINHILNILKVKSNKESKVLDFFAGSATTGQSVIELNTEDEGNRKYILMQVGDIFDNVTKPRMERTIYSSTWSDGMPVSCQGVSQCFKYICLEQYEDTLNNIFFNDKRSVANGSNLFERYMLSYMLDDKTKDSLLSVKKFETPFKYELKVTKDNENTNVKVDLVETFNYLIGLNVEQEHWYLDDNICTVEGVTHEGNERTLIIWRNFGKVNNEELNKFFAEQEYAKNGKQFDTIYVNCDNMLARVRQDNEHWTVKLTEDEFNKRMFE